MKILVPKCTSYLLVSQYSIRALNTISLCCTKFVPQRVILWLEFQSCLKGLNGFVILSRQVVQDTEYYVYISILRRHLSSFYKQPSNLHAGEIISCNTRRPKLYHINTKFCSPTNVFPNPPSKLLLMYCTQI